MDPTLKTDRKSHASLVTLKRAHIQAVYDILLITVIQMKEATDLLKVVEQNSDISCANRGRV